jgi:hypothetical protein
MVRRGRRSRSEFSMTDLKHNSVGHEAEGTDIRAVSLTALTLAIGIAMVLIVVYGMFQYLAHRPVIIGPSNPLAEADRQQFPPFPRIEEHPANEVKELHAEEDRLLSTYGWMDKKAAVVRIPIDRAMELQLQRGFPVRKDKPTR